jgi:hypothetical protein
MVMVMGGKTEVVVTVGGGEGGGDEWCLRWLPLTSTWLSVRRTRSFTLVTGEPVRGSYRRKAAIPTPTFPSSCASVTGVTDHIVQTGGDEPWPVPSMSLVDALQRVPVGAMRGHSYNAVGHGGRKHYASVLGRSGIAAGDRTRRSSHVLLKDVRSILRWQRASHHSPRRGC